MVMLMLFVGVDVACCADVGVCCWCVLFCVLVAVGGAGTQAFAARQPRPQTRRIVITAVIVVHPPAFSQSLITSKLTPRKIAAMSGVMKDATTALTRSVNAIL